MFICRQDRKIHTIVQIALYFLAGCILSGLLGAHARAQSDKTEDSVAPPQGFREVGGSNYAMCKVDEIYRVQRKFDTWYNPGTLHPVIGMLHLHPKQEILNQLKTMHDGGQRKITLVLWYDHITTEPLTEGCYGHAIRSNGGRLLPQHEANLRALLKMLRETNYFNEIIFRFVGQGPSADPGQWDAWNEAMYKEDWNFMVSTRAIVQEELKSSPIKVTYDLGVEVGGMRHGQMRPYMKRLWRDYVAAFGKKDTYGFSLILDARLLKRMIEIYDETGVRPDLWAVDVYDRYYERFGAAAKVFKAAGIENPKIILQEVYYNNPQVLKELQRTQKAFNLDFQYIMQWQNAEDKNTPHFCMDYPAAYDAYVVRKNEGKN